MFVSNDPVIVQDKVTCYNRSTETTQQRRQTGTTKQLRLQDCVPNVQIVPLLLEPEVKCVYNS
jgi:hypothetical protein